MRPLGPRERKRMPILCEDDDDPMTSAINVVDVFFVAMVMLMIGLARAPEETVTIIRDPGKDTMEIVVKDGRKTERFRASGASREGNGIQAGVAYRMDDGTMVYVPQSGGDGQ